jgi:hypothetical protein
LHAIEGLVTSGGWYVGCTVDSGWTIAEKRSEVEKQQRSRHTQNDEYDYGEHSKEAQRADKPGREDYL